MKCAREVQAGQVFCQECLADMDKYPVKPDTAILLPKRAAHPAAKRAVPKKRFRNPEEQITHLRKVIRWLILTIVALALSLAVVTAVSIHFMDREEVASYIGRNYSTITSGSTFGN